MSFFERFIDSWLWFVYFSFLEIVLLLQIKMHHLPGLEAGPSACKLSVQTTTPPVLNSILIEQQAIILPR